MHQLEKKAATTGLASRPSLAARGGPLPSSFVYSRASAPAALWKPGGCGPQALGSRRHPCALIPRESKRGVNLYRSGGAVEREFGRLKHAWSLTPLRVRGIERVQLHADLTILAKLSGALARVRALPFAA